LSIRWLTAVWDSSPYDGTKLLIHLGMADHANEEGRFFVAQTSLARKARSSVEYVRRTVATMIEDELLIIEKKGHSKGRATEYRLLPNLVGRSEKVLAVANSPTLEVQLPNFDPATPQLSSVTNVLYNSPNTNLNNESFKVLAKECAEEWWLQQSPRPIGKGAWHALLKVCEASTERGYSKEQIATALNQVGVVPSIQQMERALRQIKPMSARQERLKRGLQSVETLSAIQLLELTGDNNE